MIELDHVIRLIGLAAIAQHKISIMILCNNAEHQKIVQHQLLPLTGGWVKNNKSVSGALDIYYARCDALDEYETSLCGVSLMDVLTVATPGALLKVPSEHWGYILPCVHNLRSSHLVEMLEDIKYGEESQ